MSPPSVIHLPLPELLPDRCHGCGACVVACPGQVLVVRDNHAWLANPAACDYCGRCEEACAHEAIRCPYEVVTIREQVSD